MEVAPKANRIGFRKIVARIMMIAPMPMLLYSAVLATLFAVALSSQPKSLDK